MIERMQTKQTNDNMFRLATRLSAVLSLVLDAGALNADVPNLNESHAAEYFSIPTRVLEKMRKRGEGPEYVVVGGQVRYSRASLAAFAARQTRRSEVAA